MFDWIADVTTDRTFQVRVGDALSANGTNQGSMISTELFISMIEDLPNNLQRAATSFYADDSSLYMTHVKGPRLGITPPWFVALLEVDRSLSQSEAPNILAALSLDKIDQ